MKKIVVSFAIVISLSIGCSPNTGQQADSNKKKYENDGQVLVPFPPNILAEK